MCKLCGNDTDEHPPGCCNLTNLIRMAHGGETFPTSPLEMGVKALPGKTYYHTETFAEIEARRKKVDNLLKKYQEED